MGANGVRSIIGALASKPDLQKVQDAFKANAAPKEDLCGMASKTELDRVQASLETKHKELEGKQEKMESTLEEIKKNVNLILTKLDSLHLAADGSTQSG